MRHRAWNGLVAMLLVALMVLGGFAILASMKATASGHTIWGVVRDSKTLLPIRADVTLVEAHGGFTLGPVRADAGGVFSFAPSAGRYYLSVDNGGYFRNVTDSSFITFNGSANLPVGIVFLTPYGGSSSPLTVHTDVGAKVTVINATRNQTVASKAANSIGDATFNLWNGTFWLMTNKTGKETSVTLVTLLNNTTVTQILRESLSVVGTILGDGGLAITTGGAQAYLFDANMSKPIWKRLIAANVQGTSGISFDAYAGTFTLIVDADGYVGKISTVTVASSMVLANQNVTLTRTGQSTVSTKVAFTATNWTTLRLNRNVTLAPDGVVEGLPYGFVHDTQLQVDLALGNGDGVVSTAERNLFWGRLNNSKANNMTTDGFLSFNGRTFVANDDFTVTVAWPALSYNSQVTYNLAAGSTIPQGQKQYYLNVTGRQDSSVTTTDYTYSYQINPGYERTSATVVQGVASVTNFTTIRVDPTTSTAAYARVNMILQTNGKGQANWKVISPTDRFYEQDTDRDTYRAIVAGNVSIQLSAEESTYENAPDNRAPAEFNYTWKVSTGATLYGQKPTYNFQTVGLVSIKLILTYPSLVNSTRTHNLTADRFAPTPGTISVTFNGNPVPPGGQVDEKANVRFSPSQWNDKDGNGILRYEWDFNGDKVTSGLTPAYIDHSFPNPGTFNVTLTEVDYAGNRNTSAPVVIHVRDVTKPNAGFTINQPPKVNVESLTEGITYTFDASKLTTDNFDQPTQMTYAWTFGDNATAQGSTVTHAYANYGTYSVTLAVTDRAGNKQAINKSTTVNPEYSARPDLAVKNLRLDPSKPQESTFLGSSKVKISVEVTNNGEVPAGNINVSLLVYRQGEALPTPIKETDLTWYDGNQTTNNATIGPHKTKRVEFTWIPGAASNWTIRVTVNDGREPTQRTSDNTVALQTDVFEASWKRPALYGAIVVVVAGIPALFYLRRRMADRRAEEGEEEESGTRLTRRQRANRKKGEEKEE